MRSIARALKVRPQETSLLVSMVTLSFVGMAGLAIGQSGTNALFFARIGTDALPVMYLAQGATAFVFMLALAGILGRADRRRAYRSIPAGLAAVVVAERLVLLTDESWILPLLWLTVAVSVLLQNVFVWGVAGVVTDTRRAKRLFPLFAAGEILGSVTGGVLTGPLVRLLGTENLLLVWAAALVTSFLLCRVVLRTPGRSVQPRPHRTRSRRTSPWRDLTVAFGYVSRSRLLVWMTIAAVLFSVLFFSLYLPWATAATDRYPDAGDLAGFFGLFWAAMTGGAFLISVLVTNRLFGWFGIASVMIVLPILYSGSFAILIVNSGFLTLVILRFVDGVWLQGVASPAWETLTNVVPDARRDQVRAFLNGGPAQAGTVIAGVIALVGQEVLSPRGFAAIGLVTALITVLVVSRVRASYTSALVDALRAGRPHIFSDVAVAGVPFAFDRDAQTVEAILEATSDDQGTVRRLAVQLLTGVDDERARSALERSLGDQDASVRAEAVIALTARLEDPARHPAFLSLIRDPDPAVAASAAASIAEGSDGGIAVRRLGELAADPDPSVRTIALRQLRRVRADVAAPIASSAADDPDPGVRATAISTLGAVDPFGAREPAIRLFDDPSPRVRAAAASAVAQMGDVAVDDALMALDRPHARDAALAALPHLDRDDRTTIVRRLASRCVADATRDGDLAAAIPGDDGAEGLLKAALLERARANGRTALRATSLVSSDGAAVRSAIESLDASDTRQVANALETLEATTEGALVRPLLALWETPEPGSGKSVQDWLERALRDSDALIAGCAARIALARNDQKEGEVMVGSGVSMPLVERVLFLRHVPLFEELTPSDLRSIAEVADEQSFGDGEDLAVQGEMGDALHIIASGTVRVEAGSTEIARRGQGDVVGEMSLITRDPRMASLVADGDVHTIRIGRREFESMVHDRPDIAFGVMRVLARRLAEPRHSDRSRQAIS